MFPLLIETLVTRSDLKLDTFKSVYFGVCVCLCLYVCMCMNIHVKARGQCPVSPSNLFIQCLSLNLPLPDW